MTTIRQILNHIAEHPATVLLLDDADIVTIANLAMIGNDVMESGMTASELGEAMAMAIPRGRE